MQPIFAGFETLEKLLSYTKAYPEYPTSDDDNWLNPSYDSFYKRIRLDFLGNLFLTLKIIRRPWTPINFVTLLKDVVKIRQDAHLSGRIVARMQPDEGSKIFIWGDIHGAVHSMARDLEFLHESNIITKDLKLVEKNHYFIFNGDNVDRSPYSVETLSLLLQLIKNNPDQVIVVRGEHESNNYWYNFGLKQELKLRLSHLSKEPIPFGDLVNAFFNTLPLAVYLSSEQNPKDVIRISHSHRDDKVIDEEQMGDFFSRKQESTIIYNDLDNSSTSDTAVDIKIVIETEVWRKEKRIVGGIGLLDQDLGSTAWAVLSSPITIHRKYLDFHYDAFAVVNVASPLTLSTITLTNHDLNNAQQGFKQHAPLYLQTGSQVAPDLSKPDFFIGSSLSLVTGVPIMGQRVKRGIASVISNINKKGGIQGHLLRMIIYNDDYNPKKARKNIIKLIEKNKIDTILLPTGSPTLASYLDLVKENKVLVLFPVTGAPQFRVQDLTGIVHYRVSYAEEAKALIDYLISTLDMHKYSLFYQDDDYGIGPMKAAQAILKAHNLEKGDDVPYHRTTVDFSTHAEKIRLYQPEAIGLFSAALPTLELLRTIGTQELMDKKLFSISFLGEESIRNYAIEHGVDILFSAVVPNPWVSQNKIVTEYRDTMNQYEYQYDAFSLEAFIGINILIDTLENIDPPFSKDKIKQKLESLNNYQFKDLILTFNTARRDLTDFVWLETDQDAEWEKIEAKRE